jgi:hypothetical protein
VGLGEGGRCQGCDAQTVQGGIEGCTQFGVGEAAKLRNVSTTDQNQQRLALPIATGKFVAHTSTPLMARADGGKRVARLDLTTRVEITGQTDQKHPDWSSVTVTDGSPGGETGLGQDVAPEQHNAQEIALRRTASTQPPSPPSLRSDRYGLFPGSVVLVLDGRRIRQHCFRSCAPLSRTRCVARMKRQRPCSRHGSIAWNTAGS